MIIITGSEGFVGKYVVRKFLDEGYQVLGIDNQSKYGRIKFDHHNHPRFKFLRHDLTHESKPNLIRSKKPQIVIDLAEDVGGISYLNTGCYEKLRSSMMIRTNVLNGIKPPTVFLPQTSKYICISSSCVYERCMTIPTPEIDVLDLPTPISPYALSKFNAEYLTQFSAGNVYVARLFNVAGKGDDSPDKAHVIADLVRKFKNCEGRPIKLYGTGEQIRNFTHGDDVANALYLIATKSRPGQVYNVGSNNNIRIWDLAVKIAERVGINSGIQPTANPRFNIHISEPNWTKLSSLGYVPKWDIEQILDEAVEYYA